jgi:hypothetical protein
MKKIVIILISLCSTFLISLGIIFALWDRMSPLSQQIFIIEHSKDKEIIGNKAKLIIEAVKGYYSLDSREKKK